MSSSNSKHEKIFDLQYLITDIKREIRSKDTDSKYASDWSVYTSGV